MAGTFFPQPHTKEVVYDDLRRQCELLLCVCHTRGHGATKEFSKGGVLLTEGSHVPGFQDLQERL